MEMLNGQGPSAEAGDDVKCCGCLSILCGIKTLMIYEIFYVIIWTGSMVMVINQAADRTDVTGVSPKNSSLLKNYDDGVSNFKNYYKNAAHIILYIGIGLFIAEIPRLFCLFKLLMYGCRSSAKPDSDAERQNLVLALNSLLFS